MKTPSETITTSLRKMRRKVLRVQTNADAVNLDEITGTELRRLELFEERPAALPRRLP